MSNKASLASFVPRKKAPSAFSLVEVVLALGVFALTIVTVLGLLTPLAREVREIRDRQAASKTPGAIDQELNRLGYEFFVDVGGNFVLREGQFPLLLAVRYDGSLATILRPAGVDDNPRTIDPENQYFLAHVDRFHGGNLAFAPGPDDPDAHVAFRVTVIWPFRTPGSPPDFLAPAFLNEPADRRAFSPPASSGQTIQDWADENRLSTFTYNTAIVIGQSR